MRWEWVSIAALAALSGCESKPDEALIGQWRYVSGHHTYADGELTIRDDFTGLLTFQIGSMTIERNTRIVVAADGGQSIYSVATEVDLCWDCAVDDLGSLICDGSNLSRDEDGIGCLFTRIQSGTGGSSGVSSSSGGQSCASCNDLISGPYDADDLCPASAAIYESLQSCACQQCTLICSADFCGTDFLMSGATQGCEACFGSACRTAWTACLSDT